jgi:hypothetical protein
MDDATATRMPCPFPGLRPFWREEATCSSAARARWRSCAPRCSADRLRLDFPDEFGFPGLPRPNLS